jgi:uncharacterized membrane protein
MVKIYSFILMSHYMFQQQSGWKNVQDILKHLVLLQFKWLIRISLLFRQTLGHAPCCDLIPSRKAEIALVLN